MLITSLIEDLLSMQGFRIAYIVYKTTASLMKAVKESCDDTIILANLTQPPVIGLKSKLQSMTSCITWWEYY